MTEREDKRIDDLAATVHQGFVRVDGAIRGLREEMGAFRGQSDQRFGQLDQRFMQIDDRFVQIDQRFGQVDQRLAQMDQRFARLEDRMDRWGLAIFVTMLGLLAANVVPSLGS